MMRRSCIFFNDTATTEIYTLSLHDALPIYPVRVVLPDQPGGPRVHPAPRPEQRRGQGRRAPHHPRLGPAQPAAADRKSTRLNSSHANISYAVFCLKKNMSLSARHPSSTFLI